MADKCSHIKSEGGLGGFGEIKYTCELKHGRVDSTEAQYKCNTGDHRNCPVWKSKH